MKVILFLLFSFNCFACDILFYLQDAGETNALLPVAEKLKSEGFDVEILVGGVAKGIVKGKGASIDDFGVAVDPNWKRTDRLDSAVIDLIVSHYHPKAFVSGVAFELEGQFYDAFQASKVHTVAFWDNFSSEGQDPYFTTARSVEAHAETLWVPSPQVAEAFKERRCLSVVGHPSLQKWAADAESVDREAVRSKLGLAQDDRVCVFVGGYGPLYEQAYGLCLDFVKETDDVTILVQPHPKYAGSFESGFDADVKVLNNEITTIEAIAISDFVFCHQSTVGFQAQYIGKPVSYFIPDGQQAPSFALNRVSSPSDYSQAFEQKKGPAISGLPLHSTELCTKLLSKYKE
jgi:hypothetical protein